MIIASFFTWNLLVLGAIRGLIIALVAMGIVLIYRSSRVINFAVGDLGVPSAALLGVMAGAHGWPYWPALIGALAIGTLAGALVELTVVRRLFRAPRVIMLVATIGVAQLAQAVTLALPEYRTGSLQTSYPTAITGEWDLPGDIVLKGPQLLALIVVPLITIALWWLLGHTAFGESVRASVGNPDLARLTGINPKMVSTAVWAISGFLSAMSMILITTDAASSDLVNLGPSTLLRGLTAALVGRMVSFPKAVIASVAIGVIDSLLLFNYTDDPGLVQFVLFLAVVVLVARARRVDMGTESFQFAPRHHVVSARLRDIWWVKRLPQMVAVLALVFAIALPQILTESAKHLTYTQVVAFAIAAVSVTVLTGWAGQLSLGQMAFAGIGALTAAACIRGVDFTFGIASLRLFDGSIPSLPFGWALLVGALVACATAALIGLTALRVRGLMLAASTLAFAIAAQAYVFRQPVLSLGRPTVRLPREDIGPFDLTHKNLGYYYFSLTVLVLVLIVVSRLRRSGIGRTIIGVRENEPAAEAFTVSPTKAKVTAYAVGGFLAGLSGALLGGLVVTVGYTERFFRVQDSFLLVAMAVIGGLGSLAGAVIGAVWVIGLPAFWPKNELVPLFTSSIGLLLILLYIPGGFTQVAYWCRDALLQRVERRLGPAPPKATAAPPSSLALSVSTDRTGTNEDGSALATHGLSVTFGGLVAVNEIDFRAMPGQVVGLIGANGAGKSTLLNAIGGFVPSRGRVELLGDDISSMAANRRARRGLGRTFQAALLFPELTVREVVELALEARQRTSFWSTALFLPRASRLERRRHAEAAELIDFLGLGRYADRFIAELSTGTRRIVELAALLAVAPRVICLDEPTAGVAQREAEAFGPLIKRLQAELSATLVVVEHDLPLILAITDHVYCLEAGSVIAHGAPAEMRTNALVVASYLGTDDRATMRSNTAPVLD